MKKVMLVMTVMGLGIAANSLALADETKVLDTGALAKPENLSSQVIDNSSKSARDEDKAADNEVAREVPHFPGHAFRE